MTLSDFAMLSTSVSGIAVTVSLIYLIIQTRQNTRHTRALIVQGATARTTAILTQTRDFTINWIKGNGGEATDEVVNKARFSLACQTSITALEDLFCQYRNGLMEGEVFARNCAIHQALLSNPGMRAYWLAYREELKNIAPKFVAFVDSLCVGDAAFNLRL